MKDIELRLSPLYAFLFIGGGVVFVFLGSVPSKAGPLFHQLAFAGGLLAIGGGIIMYLRRPVIVRLTARSLQLPGRVIVPWEKIDRLERKATMRRYWIYVFLKEPRKDLTPVQIRARQLLRASNSPGADADYSILETDLPCSGVWFVDECMRRVRR
jgi:hypothetical protein